ncbi:MAG: hypothetical protein K0R65_2589 [Crocinitomicaceae bacterium]|jgi:chromosome segregation ATPase|nr:hypothetical protein [Crocinitomicaceae bacterium]
MRYAAFLILTLSLLACQDLKKDGQIKEIEALEQKLDRIKQVLEDNRTDSVTLIIANAALVEDNLRIRAESDTVTREQGEKINEFKKIRQQLPPVLKIHSELQKRIREEEKALQNLKADIDKAAGDKAKYDEYIALERQKTTELGTELENTLAVRKQCFDSYKRLHKEMEAFSKSL